jgi:hypothetical protein
MAQNDYVHLTAPGHHMIGDAMFRDLIREYDLFVKQAAGESRRPRA